MPARSLGSRACSFSTCAWLLDYAGPDGDSRYCPRQCCLPVGSTRSAPGISFSKLDSSPVNASVYTSPGTSRHPAQDSRSRWFATPFLWGSFIPDCTPVYPDACASFGRGSAKPARNCPSRHFSEAIQSAPGAQVQTSINWSRRGVHFVIHVVDRQDFPIAARSNHRHVPVLARGEDF